MAQKQKTNDNNKKFNWGKLILNLIMLVSILLLLWWLFIGFNANNIEQLSYNDFIAKLKSMSGGNWKSITTNLDSHKIFSTYIDNKNIVHHYCVLVDPFRYNEDIVQKDLIGKLTNITKDFYSTDAGVYSRPLWESILITILPLCLFLGLMVVLMKGSKLMPGSEGGILGMGSKSHAKKIISDKRFKDVAGLEETKEEVREVVDFLKRPAKYKAAGARIPKGIMLGGPPGTGKTLIAKAVAGEAGIPFYFASASSFVEMFAGMGAKRVREMFKEARKNAPSILFIDELDAIGRKRGSSFSGNDEREQTLNQILVEMDGMLSSTGLLVIAATNRSDVLDPALLRPGRFDRIITVSLPDIKEREMILRLHAKGKRISSEVDFKNIAKRTPRYSGAELENVINEATLLSVRESTKVITLLQIDEAIDRVMSGPAKKHRVITEEENKLVAIHEAGHAVVGLKVKDANIVQKITIIPRGNAGGYTLTTPKKEQYNYRKTQMEAMIMGFLGGRAAEQVYYGHGEVTTGAADDIQKATNIARSMVTQYGMSILGPVAYEKPQGSQSLGMDYNSKEYSDSLAERIDEAIRVIVLDAEKKAIKIIENNKKIIDLIVEELLEKETIVIEEIDYINKYEKRPPKKLRKDKKEKSKSLDEIISEVKTESSKNIEKNKEKKDK